MCHSPNSTISTKICHFSPYVQSSALCSPYLWSSYNCAQNFIRKHAVNAKLIFISLLLINYVEMEVQEGVCIFQRCCGQSGQGLTVVQPPTLSWVPLSLPHNILWLELYSVCVRLPLWLFFARLIGSEWFWCSIYLSAYAAIIVHII